jgi:hypothetical protein
MDKKEYCWVCGKEKKPYIVFMNDDIFNYLTYEHAREKGPICERCDKYFAMTGEFKDATDEEFELAIQSRKFAHKMLEWWQKDEKLNVDEPSPREWEGTEPIAKWYRETELEKWWRKVKKAEKEMNEKNKKTFDPSEISLCSNCYCATHTLNDGTCGKCKKNKIKEK